MTMSTSYIGTALVNAHLDTTSGRHVDHSMDAACYIRLNRKEFCAELEVRSASMASK